MHIDNIVIEITRKCNMSCDHCLRGEPENMVIDVDYVNQLFSQVESIGTLTITGGEPSLHPEIIMDIVDLARSYGIEINNFYMVTNGKKVTGEFLMAVTKLWAYCSDNEVSTLAVSGDLYHDELKNSTINKLRAFSFFNIREEGQSYDNMVISEGRGENYYGNKEVSFSEFTIEDDYISDSYLYLNCEGNLLGACDLSYESQREKALIIANVQDKKFNLLRSIKKYNKKFKNCSSLPKSEMLELEYA